MRRGELDPHGGTGVHGDAPGFSSVLWAWERTQELVAPRGQQGQLRAPGSY